MQARATELGIRPDVDPPRLWRRLARLLHPDVGGDRAVWHQLDQARGLLAKGGLL